ncbi:hypothetical protein A946_04595 [Methylacidiphilum kamchatkense Kam1]|uniref:Uncharacterized protein n=1 Tax=Methylacidiphilum kamchatkense Kam1 TaxID=1202785 RepID=A0ABR4ZWU6_9BACT|nr:hypothetical protein A946_04595 [Methylacidiphilum kamchatkense Kam1]
MLRGIFFELAFIFFNNYMLIEKESTMKFVFRMVLDVNFTVKQVLLIGKKDLRRPEIIILPLSC